MMKSHLAVVAISFVMVTAGASAIDNTSAAAQTSPPAGYRLVWADDFNDTTVDTNRWIFRAESKLRSTQLPENVSVSNGCLRIELRKEKSRGKKYTGGGLISRETFKYGYYEARMRVPPGAGWHTSFWMMKSKSAETTQPGAPAQEIDVVEQNSSREYGYSAGVIDWSDPKKPRNYGRRTFGRKNVETPKLCDGFHV